MKIEHSFWIVAAGISFALLLNIVKVHADRWVHRRTQTLLTKAQHLKKARAIPLAGLDQQKVADQIEGSSVIKAEANWGNQG